jgi:hypothetical protein
MLIQHDASYYKYLFTGIRRVLLVADTGSTPSYGGLLRTQDSLQGRESFLLAAGSGAHPASYPKGTRGPFPGG